MIRVAAGVVFRGREVLVGQRLPGRRHPGRWEFPGGKIELGESEAEALRRELCEELGLDADVGELLWRNRHCYPGEEPLELAFFRVREIRGRLVNRVFAAVRWVSVEDLCGLDLLDGDREFAAWLATRGGGDR